MITPRSASAHVFVADLERPQLSAGDHHHVARVLRLPPGTTVTASDGRGGWRPCRTTRSAALEPSGEVVVDAVPAPPLTVAFALVKGERPELIVQKLTELGIDRIVPFVAERSVVRWDPPKVTRQAARLREVARQAAMQCRRTHLPVVSELTSFDAVAALDGATLADMAGAPVTDACRTVLVGPEGGWSERERAVDLALVRLGDHVLRAETAAITAAALMSAIRGGAVRSAG